MLLSTLPLLQGLALSRCSIFVELMDDSKIPCSWNTLVNAPQVGSTTLPCQPMGAVWLINRSPMIVSELHSFYGVTHLSLDY